MSNENQAWGSGIGSAVAGLKAGHRVRRTGWGADAWLSMTKGQFVAAEKFWSVANRDFARSQKNGEAFVMPYVTIKTAEGGIVPWVCSQADLLADDWEVLPL